MFPSSSPPLKKGKNIFQSDFRLAESNLPVTESYQAAFIPLAIKTFKNMADSAVQTSVQAEILFYIFIY